MALSNEIQILVEAKVNKAIKDINRLRTTTAKTAQKSTGALSVLKSSWLGIAGAVAGATAAFIKFVNVGKEFEAAIARVASVAGKEAIPALKKFAREAALATKFTAKEAADALFFLASAGLEVKDMAKVLTPALNLATAANLEVAEATDLVVGQLKTYQADMEEAANFTDILTRANQLANTDVRQLGEALKFVSPLAAGLKIPFEKLNVVIAGLADVGIKGGIAGTQLRQAFSRLIKPTGAARAVLEKFGITQEKINETLDDPIRLFKLLEPATKDAADATTIFGVRQQGVIALIRDQIPNLERLEKGMESFGGSAERAAKIQLDTLEGALFLLKSAVTEVTLSIQESGGLQDSLKNLVTQITGVVKKIAEFLNSAEGIQKVSAAFLLLKITAQGAILGIKLAFQPIQVLFSIIKNQIQAVIESLKILGDETLSLGEKFKAIKSVAKKELGDIGDDGQKLLDSTIKSFKDIGSNSIEIYKKLTEDVKAANVEIQASNKETADKAQEDLERQGEGTGKRLEKELLTSDEIKSIRKDLAKFDEELDNSTLERKILQLEQLRNLIVENENQLLLAKVDTATAIGDIDTRITELQKQNSEELFKKRVDDFTKTVDTIKGIETKAFAVTSAFHNLTLAQIEDKKAKGILNEEQAASAKANANKKFAVFEKGRSIAEATIATLLAISKALPNIPLSVAVGILGAAQVAAIGATPIPGFQRGGTTSGGLAMVGEGGPELASFPGGTRIFNNQQTSEILNRNISIENITLPNVIDPESFFQEMQNFQRQNGVLQTEA